jgi:hypothetical protein
VLGDPSRLPVSADVCNVNFMMMIMGNACLPAACLPAGAWRSIKIAGQRRLLQPLLITGAKVWHLRPDSSCPTKHQLWAAVSQLPVNAEVVLLLGEIDCREGLLTAVERMKVSLKYICCRPMRYKKCGDWKHPDGCLSAAGGCEGGAAAG